MQLRLEVISASPPLVRNATAAAERQPDRSEIVGHKGSIFYRAHSYHTKVPPEGIAALVEHYTDPGDVVVDPFCGSGMSGVACLMTGRFGVLSDLSPAACHIASGYVARIDPRALKDAASGLLRDLADLEDVLYGLNCPECSGRARVEYTVWSDVFACPKCEHEIVFWQRGVDHDGGAVHQAVECDCGLRLRKRSLRWLRTEPVLESISCHRCKRLEFAVNHEERERVLQFDRREISAWYPTRPFESWREMWRGQHGAQGIETAADFFTPRNLRALAQTWERASIEPDDLLRQGLRFAFTAMINRASRRYQWNPKRPTNVLTSTLYLASLSYEFNVFSLLRRKLASTRKLYSATEHLPGDAAVHQASAQQLDHLPDGSADYIFTDPPFGSNIFYADSSFLWESWLNEATDITREAVVHRSQRPDHGGKSLQDYEKLMAEAFAEVTRILRPNGWASVMFHNSSDEVWSTISRAIDSADLEVGAAVAFDKSQASFKGLKGQLAGEKVPSFDLVLHLRRHTGASARRHDPSAQAAVRDRLQARLRKHVATAPVRRRSTTYLHSFVMRVLLEEGLPIEGFAYSAVEDLCQELFIWDGRGWAPRHNPEDE